MGIENAPEWKTCLAHLLDPSVSEVEANGPNSFFIKKSGKRIHLKDISLPSDDRYVQGIEEALIPVTRPLAEYRRGDYLYEAPLDFKANGQRVRGRVHIVLPPASDTPQITIAKKSTSLVSLEDIAGKGSMAKEMYDFIRTAMKANLTIAFSGGTGAGKTTMLEACTKLIPTNVRIGVAEDTPELALDWIPNVSYLHSHPWRPGMDPNDVATLDWVVQQFQRMRVDRLIIGETRGKEFAGFLTAANSGMEGSMTTIHANNPKQCLDKMSNFALRGSERQPVRSVNKDIANTIDIIIQLSILSDGRHKISAIEEVTTTLGKGEDAGITTKTLYGYDQHKDAFFKTNNIEDKTQRHFKDKGIDYSHLLQTPVGSRLSMMAPPATVPDSVQATASRGLPIPKRGS